MERTPLFLASKMAGEIIDYAEMNDCNCIEFWSELEAFCGLRRDGVAQKQPESADGLTIPEFIALRKLLNQAEEPTE